MVRKFLKGLWVIRDLKVFMDLEGLRVIKGQTVLCSIWGLEDIRGLKGS